VLADAVPYLGCPHCGSGLAHDGPSSLRCAGGRHSFDVARQGYVNLLPGDAHTGTADSAEMVAARAAFLSAGHYAPLARALAEGAVAAAPDPEGCVLDLGAGTGHYLAAVLDALPAHRGVALDISKYALRRAARAHPRAGAVVGDAWRRLPLRDGAASLVLNVFAPRRGAEIRRVLRPEGTLLVAAPTTGHLAELVGALGLLAVDERKEQRVEAALGPELTRVSAEVRTFPLELGRAAVAEVVRMGPSAWHTDARELQERIAALPDPVRVTASVTVAAYRVERAAGGEASASRSRFAAGG
jgi:23S rRNA (guanine745-N1)-methyltransferase